MINGEIVSHLCEIISKVSSMFLPYGGSLNCEMIKKDNNLEI